MYTLDVMITETQPLSNRKLIVNLIEQSFCLRTLYKSERAPIKLLNSTGKDNATCKDLDNTFVPIPDDTNGKCYYR